MQGRYSTAPLGGKGIGPKLAGRLRTKLGGQPVSVLGREDLRANKLAAGRPKDLLDVELLARLPKTKKRR